MFRDSLRAGTITVTRGGSAGSRGDSASRDVERAIRSEATMGVTIHGIVATMAVPVESLTISSQVHHKWFTRLTSCIRESYSYFDHKTHERRAHSGAPLVNVGSGDQVRPLPEPPRPRRDASFPESRELEEFLSLDERVLELPLDALLGVLLGAPLARRAFSSFELWLPDLRDASLYPESAPYPPSSRELLW
jgi:hypothetical protein